MPILNTILKLLSITAIISAATLFLPYKAGAQHLEPMPDTVQLLRQIAGHPQNDTDKVLLYYRVSDVFGRLREYKDNADESLVFYYLQALKLSMQLRWDKGILMGEQALSWKYVRSAGKQNKALLSSVIKLAANLPIDDIRHTVMIYIGAVSYDLKNNQAAADNYNNALTYFISKHNVGRMLQLPEFLSLPYSDRGFDRPFKVDSILNQGLAMARAAKNSKYIARYLSLLAYADHKYSTASLMDEKKASGYFKESLALAEGTNDEEDIYTDIFEIGYINEADKQYQKNLDLYKTGAYFASKNRDHRSLTVFYGSLANTYVELKDNKNAEKYYALEADNAASPTDAYTAYTDQKNYYLQRFNYVKAIQANEKALFYVQKTDRLILQYFILMNLGEIYSQVGNSSKAIVYFNKALKALGHYGKSYLGIVATEKGAALVDEQPQKAITYLAYALKNNRREDWDLENYSLLSTAWYDLNNYSKALMNAQLAIKDSIGGNFNYRARALRTIGAVLRDAPDTLLKNHGFNTAKRYAMALTYLNRSRVIINNSDDPASERDNWKELSLTYGKLKSYLAYPAYLQYILLRDSVSNRQALAAFQQREADVVFNKSADSLKAQQQVVNVKLRAKQVQSYYLIGGILLLIGLAVFIIRTAINTHRSNKLLATANAQISNEKQRSDDLLLNILPADVAEELKEKGSSDARLFDEVTVLFTDFVNFTKVSELLTPQQLVAELNVCFKAFDGIMTSHNIEKIKTVGDAYLAVSGLPVANTDHAVNVLNAAQEIQRFMLARKQEMGDKSFGIRIGVHSGSVVAGIVGIKKFAYDIWGDTVNTAARMEQNSEPGKINVSEKTYEATKNRFIFTYRGEIAAKNKGAMKMYFLEG